MNILFLNPSTSYRILYSPAIQQTISTVSTTSKNRQRKQIKAKHSKTKQSKAKQSKAKQSNNIPSASTSDSSREAY
jgi:hypothetical protein